MKEMIVASNMIALARSRKGGNKRSAMLRMIMPFLSKETGDSLAAAIHDSNSVKFAKMWDKVKGEIVHKLKDARPKHLTKPKDVGQNKPPKQFHHKNKKPPKHHHAMASDVSTARDIGSSGEMVGGCAPNGGRAVGKPISIPHATIQIDQVDNGVNYVITDEKMVALIKAVCEKLFTNEDPCPLPPRPIKSLCELHDWEDCPQCFPVAEPLPEGFDFAANILELYDRLCTAKTSHTI